MIILGHNRAIILEPRWKAFARLSSSPNNVPVANPKPLIEYLVGKIDGRKCFKTKVCCARDGLFIARVCNRAKCQPSSPSRGRI